MVVVEEDEEEYFSYGILVDMNSLLELFLQLSLIFIIDLSALFTCLYWQFGGLKVYNKSDCWNLVCKLFQIIFRRFTFLGQFPQIHILGVVLILRLTHTHGILLVHMQQWKTLLNISFMIVQLCLRTSRYSRCKTLHQIQH